MSPNLKTQEPSPSWLEERKAAAQAGSPGNDLFEKSEKSANAQSGRRDASPAKGIARQRIAQFGLALIAGVLVGGAMLLAEPFAHRCGATMKMAEAGNAAQLEKLRAELVSFLWGEDSRNEVRLSASTWLVDDPGAGLLRVSLVTTEPDAGVQKAEAAARSFVAHLQKLNEKDKTTPSEGEGFLLSYIKVLTERIDDAQKQLDEAMARLPEADPRQDKTALMNRWREKRNDFDSARVQLMTAAEEYRRLTDQGEINEVVVAAEKRQAALVSDQDLQQDIKELAVTLEELKSHMLHVRQQSAPAMEQIGSAAAAHLKELRSRDGEDASEAMKEAYSSLMSELAGYAEEAGAFAAAWTSEFDELQRSTIDAASSTLLDSYHRIQTLLNDFLFRAGNRFSSMRESVHQISRDPADDARHYLRQSDAARALAELQAAHHRFEFSAGALDTTNNFRLDSALRIARGLRRRVTDRIRAIDGSLQKEAVARAREEQKQAMGVLDAILRKSRDTSDATVEELIRLQDELQAASSSSEQFVAAVAAAELANHRLQLTRKDLNDAELQLRGLADKRASARRASELSIVAAGVVERNVNLGDRMRVAGVGASVTFLAVLLGQIVLSRALWPSIHPT